MKILNVITSLFTAVLFSFLEQSEGTVGKVGAVKRKKVAWADHSICNPLLQSAHPCQEQQTALIEVPMQCLQSNSLDKDEQDLRNGEDDQPPDEDAEIKSKAS